MVKQDILIQQFVQSINGTNFVTEAEIASLAKFTQQTRDYYYLTLPIQPIADAVSISEEQIGEYYEQTKAQYQTEVAVSVEAIELSPASLVGSLSVTEEQIQTRFDQEAEGADLTDQLQAAHIFLADPTDEKLQAIQARLDAGDNFAALAAEYSEDFVSAELGGDLGYTSGNTFPEEFEAALANLEQGQVSGPVQTDTGTHFIKLLDLQQQSYELASERSRIERELLNEAATDLLVEKLEMLKELSFNSETLSEVATDLGLDLQITEPFSRQGGDGIAAYPAVIKAAFSSEVMEEQYASEVMDLGDDRHVVIKLKEAFPARQRDLAEVRSAVVAAAEASIARQRIAEQGAALLTKVEAGSSIETVAKAAGLDWQVAIGVKRISTSVNAEVRDNVFQMPIPTDRPERSGFYTVNGDYVLASLTHVIAGDISDLSASERSSLVAAVEAAIGSRDVQAYQSSLIANADVVQ
jgi:peptidyl-prolyl cis-trans isomerase D